MTKLQIAALLTAGLFVLAAGCEMAGGLSDEAQLTAALGQWKAALEAQDVDKMMAPYSDAYEGQRGEGKEGTRQFLEGMIDQGYLEDIDMDIFGAEIKIESDKATVGPIKYAGNWGEMQTMRTLKKENDGVWRVVGIEQY